jgi:hypothetical protein
MNAESRVNLTRIVLWLRKRKRAWEANPLTPTGAARIDELGIIIAEIERGMEEPAPAPSEEA